MIINNGVSSRQAVEPFLIVIVEVAMVGWAMVTTTLSPLAAQLKLRGSEELETVRLVVGVPVPVGSPGNSQDKRHC